MYCRSCGTINDDNNFRCLQCGNVLQRDAQDYEEPHAQSYPVVLWIGLVFALLGGCLGIFLCYYAKNMIDKEPHRYKGAKVANGGMILGVVMTAVGAMLRLG